MIDKVLGFIVERLNTALLDQDPRNERPAIMGRLGGAESAMFENKIIVSLVNIERETGTRRAPGVPAGIEKLTIEVVNMSSKR
jgi:hypothetical protein